MSIINYLISEMLGQCRIMFINCNFQLLYNTLIDQNRHIKQNRTGNLLLSVLYYSLSIIAFGGVIFVAYALLVVGCVLTDECYYYYFNGGV